MMDLLVAEVDKEMTTAKLEEEDAQDDYEKLMAEPANKRATDSKAIVEKTDAKAASETELQAVKEYIVSLHTECDFLLEYYDQRKEARASEIDAMGKAKAVLSGADYSLVQMGAAVKHFL